MRRTHAVAALPVAALLLLLASFASLYTALHIDRPLNLADLDATNAAAERLRIIWGAAAFSVTAALVWNAVVSCYVLGVVLAKEDRTTRFAFVTGAAVAALVGVLMVTFLEAGGTVANELLKRIELCANVKIGFLTRIGNIAAAVTVSIMLASLSSLTTVRLKVEQNQLVSVVGCFDLGLIGLQGA